MDSPVIIDGATKFGRQLDLDRDFPAQANQAQPQPGVHQNQVPPQQSQREKSPAPQQGPKAQSNVRQIPIFVEGRDKPVIARERDEPDFSTRRQQSPPHFQRPSHFQQQYNRQPSGWGSNFQDPFFEHTGGRWNHPQPQPQSTFPEFRHTQQEKPRQTHDSEFWHPNKQQHKPHTQPQPQSQPKRQPEPQPEAPPKPKQQVQPKDPLEKVAMVQKEVDALTEQVKQFTCNSRQDKQYMYLDEMLTRELIKLDDIDTEGKENVRQARKQAIKSIQESISLLESKAPVPGQQPKSDEKTEEELEEVKEDDKKVESNEKPVEPMETNEEPVPEEQKAIPLPPPLSPSKAVEVPEAKAEVNSPSNETTQPKENNIQLQETIPVVPQTDAPVQDAQQQQIQPTPPDTQKPHEQQTQNPEPMDSSTTPAPQVPSNDVEMEIRQPSPAKELFQNPEQPKEIEEKKKTEVATTETVKTKKEPPPVPAKPGKSPKKAKKTKKQPEPVSETAIPLPAPGQSI